MNDEDKNLRDAVASMLQWAAKEPSSLQPPPVSRWPVPSTDDAVVPRILISACLMSKSVSYRGSSVMLRVDHPLTWLRRIALSSPQLLLLTPMCPEMGAGLPAPRPPVRLVRSQEPNSPPRLLCPTLENADIGKRMQPWLDELLPVEGTAVLDVAAAGHSFAPRRTPDGVSPAIQGFHGFVAKAKSPSCGVGDAKVFLQDSRHTVAELGDGHFVRQLRLRLGDASIPMITEKGLKQGGVESCAVFLASVVRRASTSHATINERHRDTKENVE
jgi:uncharacterized protein YbbK (DUF523 family)